MKEILDTERTYVSNLTTLWDVYINPILTEAAAGKSIMVQLTEASDDSNNMRGFLSSVGQLKILNQQVLFLSALYLQYTIANKMQISKRGGNAIFKREREGLIYLFSSPFLNIF